MSYNKEIYTYLRFDETLQKNSGARKMTALHCEIPLRNPEKCVSASTWCIDTPILAPNKTGNEVAVREILA